MKLYVAVALVLASTVMVVAQAAPAGPATQFTLTVSEPHLNLIGKALGKLPYEEVSQLLQELAAQVVQQQKDRQEAAKKEKDK